MFLQNTRMILPLQIQRLAWPKLLIRRRNNPFLEFVENYQTLDGKIEKLKDKTPDGSPVYYESMANIFANRDKRLAATVLYSGSEFKGKVTSIQAGQKVWNQQTGNYDYITGMSLGDKDENELLIRGFDGPSEDKNITNTGFYLKSLFQPAPMPDYLL